MSTEITVNNLKFVFTIDKKRNAAHVELIDLSDGHICKEGYYHSPKNILLSESSMSDFAYGFFKKLT